REQSYICIAPASIWFTKQLPPHKWVEMLNQLPAHIEVIMIGAPADHDLCETIRKETSHPAVYNMAGQYSLLESAALMEAAIMNYVNDSAPAHLASAVNAPVTMVYCSTVPAFGFGPVSTRSFIIETDEELDCRPCGLHGYKKCPQGHFKCADIPVNKLLDTLPSEIADPK
ncbi:MAG: glycosyltransferase family 9 protein, partial [Bacteroidota bacterium]